MTHQYAYISSDGDVIERFDSKKAMQHFAIAQLYKAVMEIPEEMAIEM